MGKEMKKSILPEKPEITTEEILLEKIERASAIHFTKDVIEGMNFDLAASFLAKSYVFTAIQQLLSFKAGDRIIRHPENWKEAFKERWFPGWLKKRFPVKHTEYDILVVFPDLLKKYPCPEILRNQNYLISYVKFPFLPSDGEK